MEELLVIAAWYHSVGGFFVVVGIGAAMLSILFGSFFIHKHVGAALHPDSTESIALTAIYNECEPSMSHETGNFFLRKKDNQYFLASGTKTPNEHICAVTVEPDGEIIIDNDKYQKNPPPFFNKTSDWEIISYFEIYEDMKGNLKIDVSGYNHETLLTAVVDQNSRGMKLQDINMEETDEGFADFLDSLEDINRGTIYLTKQSSIFRVSLYNKVYP